MVNIYIYQTIKGPGTKAGSFTYILETEINGKTATLTKTDTLEPMTENKAELTVLLKALKRLRTKCSVQVIGSSDYVRQGAEKWLKDWVRQDFKTAKGKEVANKEEWQQLLTYQEAYDIVFAREKHHSYSNWMKEETERKERERRELCSKDLENLTVQKKSTKQQ